jgi:hypothetical protein
MNRKSYSQILDRVARDHVPEQTDLACILKHSERKTLNMHTYSLAAVFLILWYFDRLISVPAVRAPSSAGSARPGVAWSARQIRATEPLSLRVTASRYGWNALADHRRPSYIR